MGCAYCRHWGKRGKKAPPPASPQICPSRSPPPPPISPGRAIPVRQRNWAARHISATSMPTARGPSCLQTDPCSPPPGYSTPIRLRPCASARTRVLASHLSLGSHSEERRLGKECVSTCRYGWSPSHQKKNNNKIP